MIGFIIYTRSKRLIIHVGPWSCHLCWPGSGRFGNRSRWFSGWYNWRKEAKYDC